MKPWFIQEDNVIPFPKKDTSVVRLPNVNAYPDFLSGVQDLQNHLKRGDISSDIHKKLYQDLIHRFMKVESFETPWFLKENQQDSTLDDVKKIASSLATITKDPTIIQVHKVRDTEDKGRPYHLRTVQKGHELDKEQAEQILKKLPQGNSIVLQPITNSQKKITSFNRAEGMQFVYQNKTYYIAVARTVQSQKGVKIKLFNKKELTPNNLGLQAVYNDRNSLAQDVTRVLQQKYKDDRGAMLSHVLNNAINFNAQTPIPQELKYLLDNQTIQRQVSQDFGEVLGPLLYGKGQISFPAGNEPIIDVKVGDVGIAIKSLTGSGNSLTKLKEVIDAYAATVDQQDVKKTANIKTIQKLADDNISVKDGILQIASDLQSPEMTALEAATLKIKIYNVAQLAEAIKKLIYDKEKLVPLDQVMVEIKKILGASGKLFGMPRNIGSAVAQKIYNQQPIKYVSNILLYGLGKGIENVIINGVEKKEYGLLLKDIMNKVQAKVGFVSVNNQGIVDFMIRDFKNLNFKFDYHAYTTNPGNNRPGFAVFP
jgi:hypothetical protein